ncbi:hypothetical protein [Methylobacterium haplocladii]|nr:hypothetical protein [Methylobacterium haplocladii]
MPDGFGIAVKHANATPLRPLDLDTRIVRVHPIWNESTCVLAWGACLRQM